VCHAEVISVISSLEIWYLHSPDRTTPYEETLKAANELYKEGKFKRFGLSAYMAYVSSLLVR
jgi:aflatoxin B1 aldehyde reductase